MKKKNYKCYDEWWLAKDMENMGYIFEYCQEYCEELFNTNIDKIKFLNAFMISKCRAEMEIGDPKLLSQAAYDTIKNFVEYEYDGETGQFNVDNNTNNDYSANQLYWVGWIYAYIHYKSKFPSSKIVEIMPIENMLKEYYTSHEMDNNVYYFKIKHMFAE